MVVALELGGAAVRGQAIVELDEQVSSTPAPSIDRHVGAYGLEALDLDPAPAGSVRRKLVRRATAGQAQLAGPIAARPLGRRCQRRGSIVACAGPRNRSGAPPSACSSASTQPVTCTSWRAWRSSPSRLCIERGHRGRMGVRRIGSARPPRGSGVLVHLEQPPARRRRSRSTWARRRRRGDGTGSARPDRRPTRRFRRRCVVVAARLG